MKYHSISQYALLALVFCLSLVACSDDTTTPPDETDNDPMASEFSLDYVKTFGGNNIDDGVSVVAANDGTYMILATTESTTGDVSGKTTDDKDLWLLKMSSDGTIIWERTYGGSNDDVAESINKTSDGGYILAGQSRSNDGDVSSNAGFFDFWILKIDASGTIQWDSSFGYEGSDQIYDVFQTSDGGYFASGVLDVTASDGEGDVGRATAHAGGDYWAIKMDANGNRIWSRYFGGTFTDTAYEAAETDNGEFIIAGFSDSTDFDITNNIGAYDFWILKVAANGGLMWEKNFGGSEIDIAYAITKTNDGGFLVVGDTRSSNIDITEAYGNADTWLTKIDTNGSLVWQKSLGGTGFDSARGVFAMPNGNFLVVGNTRSSDGDVTENKGQNDIWVTMVNSNGELLYEKTVGGSSLDFGNDILQTTDNNIIVVGNTESNDQDVTLNKGIKDVVLVKLNQL